MRPVVIRERRRSDKPPGHVRLSALDEAGLPEVGGATAGGGADHTQELHDGRHSECRRPRSQLSLFIVTSFCQFCV